ncbi:MAG TPA: hypothetical protein VGR71_15615, partial [Nitrospira sp.]|nr:hypothetical protein [Nitrospira sp.]
MQRQHVNTSGFLVGVAVVACYAAFLSASIAADDLSGISQSPDYFPDTIGSHWEYRGQITEGPLQTIEHK